MAQVLGSPSQYISKNLRQHAYFYFVVGIVFIIGVFACYVLVNQVFAFRNPVVEILLFILYFVALYYLTKVLLYVFHIDYFYRGGIGENNIAAELAKLPNNYLVFRNMHIENRKSDTDFIVLGPKGLLTVEAKSHSGNISFNGRELLKNGKPFDKDFLNQAKTEASNLDKYLLKSGFKGLVKPVLVFSSRYAKMSFGLNPQNNVFVVQKVWLIKLILSLPDVTYNVPNLVLEKALRQLVR